MEDFVDNQIPEQPAQQVPAPVQPAPAAPAQAPQQPEMTNAQALTLIADLQNQIARGSAIKLQLQSPDVFNGKKNEKIGRWLFQVEQYLRAANELRHDRMVAYAASLLRKDASTWWEDVCKNYGRYGVDESQFTWQQFKELITTEFAETNEEMKAREKLGALEQRGSVADYKVHFKTLAFAIPSLSEHDKKVQFYSGLKKEIKLQIATNTNGNPMSYDLKQLMDTAEILDDIFFEAKKKSGGNSTYGGKKSAGSGSGSGPTPMELGSVEKIPKLTDQERDRCKREGLCLACREKGHVAADCTRFPRKKDLPNGGRQ